jgi:hypothetical protein
VKTSYAIDGGPATTVTTPSNMTATYQRLFWQSDAVSNGPQWVFSLAVRFFFELTRSFSTLVVTMVYVNPDPDHDDDGTIWFDYFNVTSPIATLSSPSSLPAASTAQTSTPTALNANSSNLSTPVLAVKKSSHTAIIAGVVVPVIFVIICTALLLLRRKQRHNYGNSKLALSMPCELHPYLPRSTMS